MQFLKGNTTNFTRFPLLILYQTDSENICLMSSVALESLFRFCYILKQLNNDQNCASLFLFFNGELF